MARYKGRINTKEIERLYPHIVELMVPLSGFGTKFSTLCMIGTPSEALKANEAAVAITMAVIMFDGALSARKMRRHFKPSLAVR